MEKHLKQIKTAVLFSILLSIVSYFSIQKGLGEIYPFFYWKLYTQPYGWDGEASNYIVYAKEANEKNWTRLAKQDYKSFDVDDYGYFLRTNLKHTANHAKIKSFCKYIAPQYDDYKIVKETYNPMLSLAQKPDVILQEVFIIK